VERLKCKEVTRVSKRERERERVREKDKKAKKTFIIKMIIMYESLYVFLRRTFSHSTHCRRRTRMKEAAVVGMGDFQECIDGVRILV
jgi:hypothetical protein